MYFVKIYDDVQFCKNIEYVSAILVQSVRCSYLNLKGKLRCLLSESENICNFIGSQLALIDKLFWIYFLLNL